ncbi:GH25 family lysozyme [Fructilactobacillus sp. Tb1]|uniref:GH25 family lysozyme n=1 Tax=Fructilactobacillus sp. Tb1 TaxID=3422304 RepID=UPI003D280089
MIEMKRAQFQRNQRHHQMKKWSFLTLALIIFIAIIFIILGHIQANNQARARFFAKYPIRGVSLNQDSNYMDFNEFKQRGGSFVYIRSSQGTDYLDDNFNDNYSRSIGSGLKIGVYHQYGFGTSITGQEKNFSRAVDGQIGQLPIRIDIDYYGKYTDQTVNKQQLHQRIKQFVNYLYQRYDRPVLIKTNQTNYQTLKNIPHTQFMLHKGVAGANVTFNNLNSNDSFYKDGKSSDDSMAAYHGNKVQWKQYLERME